MAVFRDAQGCISPNWHPSQHEAHRLKGEAKSSQNMEPRNNQGATDALSERGRNELAWAMKAESRS